MAFGNNPVRPQEPGDGTSLWVQEVYYTLQGEGPYRGQPCVLVRLAGCNLSCFWCDTEFESSTWHPGIDELVSRIFELKPPHCDLIVLTGGEPFRQNIGPLVKTMLDQGLRVQIETNGTLWVDLPDHPNLSIICSPKTAALNQEILPRITAFKYVISESNTDSGDGLPNESTQKAGIPMQVFRPQAKADVYVMPMDSFSPEKNKSNQKRCVEVSETFGYQFTPQLHKVLGID